MLRAQWQSAVMDLTGQSFTGKVRRLAPQSRCLRLCAQRLRLGARVKRAGFQTQEITLLKMHQLGARLCRGQGRQLHAQLTPADLGIAHQTIGGEMRGVEKALGVFEIRRGRKMLRAVMRNRCRYRRPIRRFQERSAQGAHLGARRLNSLGMTLGGVFEQARQLQSRLRPSFHRRRTCADTGRQAQCRYRDEDQSHAYPQNRVARLRLCHG